MTESIPLDPRLSMQYAAHQHPPVPHSSNEDAGRGTTGRQPSFGQGHRPPIVGGHPQYNDPSGSYSQYQDAHIPRPHSYPIGPLATDLRRPSEAASPPQAPSPPSVNEPSPSSEGGINSFDQTSPANSKDGKRIRSCDHCRGLKVKCERNAVEEQCGRCRKARRQCHTTPATNKRKRKAETRSSESEALTALQTKMQQIETALRSQGLSQILEPSADNSTQSTTDARKKRLNSADAAAVGGSSDKPAPNTVNPIATAEDWKKFEHVNKISDHSDLSGLIEEIIDGKTAHALLARYVEKIYPHFPAVHIPHGMNADTLRREKPLVFLAIMSCSSCGVDGKPINPLVQRKLAELLKDRLAEVIWKNGEKSVEIIQAVQLGILWYRPPVNFERHAFYLMASTAGTLARDVGLGKRTSPSLPSYGKICSIENRRTYLVCYYQSVSIAMVLKRPEQLRWDSYMEESVRVLETSPNALRGDLVICYLVKLAHLGEEVSNAFHMYDPEAAISVADPQITQIMAHFEHQLRELKFSKVDIDNDPIIEMSEHLLDIYVHEIALHYNHNTEDFGAPFPSETVLADADNDTSPPVFGHAHVSALKSCLSACHRSLDAFIKVPLHRRFTLPVMFCVRTVYAVVCLMKIWFLVSGIEQIVGISKKEVRVEHYINKVLHNLQQVLQYDKQAPHGKFFFATKRIAGKFAEIKQSGRRNANGTFSFGYGGGFMPSQVPAPPPQMPMMKHDDMHVPGQNGLDVLSSLATAAPIPFLQQHIQYQPEQFYTPDPYATMWDTEMYNIPQDPEFNAMLANIDWNSIPVQHFGLFNEFM